MKPVWWKTSLAEGIGTFGLTLISAGAICADRYSGGELGLLGVSLAAGSAFTALALATFATSGAHLNPAITVAFASNGALDRTTAMLYVAAQLSGAALAGYCLAGLFAEEVWRPAQLGTPTLSSEVVLATGTFVEALLTFLLVFIALQVAEIGRSAAIVYGLAIGLWLAGGTLVAGTLTGAAMNPARAFGPALASGIWRDHIAYWIGPITGGLVAAFANRLLQPAETS